MTATEYLYNELSVEVLSHDFFSIALYIKLHSTQANIP